MKRRFLFASVALALASLTCVSCHKVCTCEDYGGRIHEYTVEEVDEHAGGNCSEMTNFPVTNNYSYCHW